MAVTADGHCLISACPGSGKTTVLSHRAGYLLGTHGQDKLAAVTFSSEAAGELLTRIRRQTQGHDQRVTAGTFHKLAKDQLAGAGIRVRLITEAQARALTLMCMRSAGFDGDLDKAMMYIQARKVAGAGSVVVTGRGEDDEEIDDVYQEYQAALRHRGVHDFQDLLLMAVEGMRNRSVKPLPVQHMLVDEAQDADDLQWAWVMEHVNVGCRVTAVGDDDQTIYGWRLASGFRGLQRFREATGATYIPLDTTYRCAPEILRHAARVIEHNRERLPKRLVTANEIQGRVHAKSMKTRAAEAVSIRETLQGGDPNEWAVLARTNSILDALELELGRAKIVYKRIGGTSVWARKLPALFLSMLESFVSWDIHGIESALQLLGASPSGLRSLMERCEASKPGSLHRFVDRPLGKGSDGTALAQLQSLCGEWRDLANANQAEAVIRAVQIWIQKAFGTRRAFDDGYIHLDACALRLTGKVDEDKEKEAKKRKLTLAQRIALVKQKPPEDPERPGVRLITCHGCKGLEFDRVWLMGCEEGVLPDSRSDPEEERRLFYVGMTRARKELVVSSGSTPVSSFFAEAALQISA